MVRLIAILVLAYLLGSIPTSVWLGKWIRGIDLRTRGSGNAGATNAFRVLGKPIGAGVLAFDICKGAAAVGLSHWQDMAAEDRTEWHLLQVCLALLAVVGHLFPVFARFRGGKGVATMAGAGLVIYPQVALASFGVYLLAFLVTRRSAWGSLMAAVSYPVWMILVFGTESPVLRIFSVAVPLLLILTHRSNLTRLFASRAPR